MVVSILFETYEELLKNCYFIFNFSVFLFNILKGGILMMYKKASVAGENGVIYKRFNC